MTIDCAFHGFVAADAESKVSKAGKNWVRLRVGVGRDDNVQWVSVAVFGTAANAAAVLRKGDRCYVEGSIRLETWRGSDGADRHGLSVAAFKCDQTHRIGRNRPRRDGGSAERTRSSAANSDANFHSDSIPF